MSERKWARGRIRVNCAYGFWCGRCGKVNDYYYLKQAWAIEVARKDGWSNTKADGWVCPSCIERAKKEASK